MLVRSKLKEADFSFIDIFDDHETFDTFSAWQLELVRQGYKSFRRGAPAVEITHQIGTLGMRLLQEIDTLLGSWRNNRRADEEINELITAVHSKAAILEYCTPETTGRLLHALIETEIEDRRHEEAVILVIRSIKSIRHYFEVMEHLEAVTPGATETEKAHRALTNEQRLFASLSDSGERAYLAWRRDLFEGSQ
ncbi:hypothetical protein [Alkalilimnicola ehrlichii]|uniref:Uncharacterized protein n=1 Tax=Alkalilimnicola ehrlichii TaxID=351052 RepID=A0A3E0WH35_9GAMM|nr:hypothetical protein [Alkalilimnicola ehrlichii]RFA31080.1 hypothetical protein CAL65_22620 [Alkalilimnicola ehrlichii]